MNRLLIQFALALFMVPASAQDKTVEQLKLEAEKADAGHQSLAYAEVAQRLVEVANKQFTDGDSVKGLATVKEVLECSTRARDAAVKDRKKMKETEIHLREAQRRLSNVRHTLAAEDRPAVEDVEKKIAGFRQDILDAMFAPKKDHK